jgi:hypothetical protein
LCAFPILLFCAAAHSFALTHPLLAFRGSAKVFHPADAQLTFAERVAYQRAIESVYWRHRIWPKERPDPKPPLDAVMSQEHLEKKVRGYLRNSQMLEDYWQRPLTTEQLQNEMDRMAKHTKQPEVLRELFEAMGNDPFVIAECLARPALAERLFTNWYAHDEKIHGELKRRAEADLQSHPAVAQMRQTSGSYNEIELVKSDGSYQQRDGGPRYAMKLNSREWDETIQKLAVTFGVRSRGGGIAAFESAAPLNYEGIPIGELSSLQEDESRFYATAVIEKTGDHLKLATVSWLKDPLESWLARAESQTCTTVTTKTAPYTLPKISEGTGGCIDDTWAATNVEPFGRPRGRHPMADTFTQQFGLAVK